MKLPIDSNIAPSKLKDYLLTPKKRNDKSKWLAQIGYNIENWQVLEKDLRNQNLSIDVKPIDKTRYGQMYEIRGRLTGPNGRTLLVCSIWMTELSTKITKFITIYPDNRRI